MMAANYDHTTWFYERLSKLVFGQAQVNAQNHFLHYIKPNSRILIIGGGTGQILEALSKLHPVTLHITYIEASANMMALSRRRNTGQNEVIFIQEYMENAPIDGTFDIVLTAFLFDNFSETALDLTFPQIDARLKPGGLWLDTDFQLTGPLWQKVMLKVMYTFFKLMKAVEVMKQPDTRRFFREYGYVLLENMGSYGDFIGSRVYEKAPSKPSAEGRG